MSLWTMFPHLQLGPPPLYSSLTLKPKEKGFRSLLSWRCGGRIWRGWVMNRRVKPFFHPFHHLFHLRKGNPQTSSTVAGGHTLGSQWKEAARNTNISYPPSGLFPGKFWKEWG